jgi:hypothetical protein
VSSLARARDFLFNTQKWVGEEDMPADDFVTGTRDKPWDLVLRDKIVANLDTDKPTIRSITPKTNIAGEESAEFMV